MPEIRNKLKRNKFIRFLSSLKITVACLSLLFILTLWGTVAQVDNGLYPSQQRFFNSFVFLAFGVIPFPGARLVLWVFFINLFCAAITRLAWRLSNLGILVIHFGIMLFLVAGFFMLHFVRESSITLMEGESTHISVAYQEQKASPVKQFPLPFMVKLIDFEMENHPGTNMARSYKSKVAIQANSVWRDIVISMNKPFRYKDYALYQSSYQIDEAGREYSTLAVVKNSGRLLPYIATFVTFAGLIIHFLVMAFWKKQKK